MNHIGADDSIYECEIITMWFIILLIIHTGADDSINEYEIITRCISISIIQTGADNSINESDIITRYIQVYSFTQEQMTLSMNMKSSPGV